MGKIVAIGGGEIIDQETIMIDKFIVDFSEKVHPRLLFIPTASGDSKGYIQTITKIYGKQLRCKVDTLLLTEKEVTATEIKQKILSSDIIYVGGGDTIKMMEIWRKKNVDHYLMEAYKKNIVLAGLSAGSICWFSSGHADNDRLVGYWDQKRPIGIGLIPAIHCPHYNKDAHKKFDREMQKEILPGIALEDNCAFVIKDTTYKIINTNRASKAFFFNMEKGIPIKKEIKEVNFTPLSHLFNNSSF